MHSKGKLKILFVSAEVSPFAKTGGLADVAGSLPLTLAASGNDVRIVMPRYGAIRRSMSYITDFPVFIGDRKETCIIREARINSKDTGDSQKGSEGITDVTVYFTDSYHYFDRGGIYCYLDDAERFAFFCKAVLEMLPRIGFRPDIIHCNDWHTGPICMLLKEAYGSNPFYSSIACLFTIHNLEYQGNFSGDAVRLFNLEENVFTPEKAEFYGMFSFMKAGLVYADIINTVSETYAREIQTAQYGEKMEGLLRERTSDLYGIVNGISYHEFNPETDRRLFRNYNSQTFAVNKKENKHALQKEMGLPVSDVPVIGLISRLTGQKGLNLIVERFDEIMKHDLQFVLLGTGDEYYETVFRNARAKYPDKFGVFIGFDAALAQRIYAGSDIFLMPSRFEPCGLGQIISLRYGTIPVVRATGGLADTIIDADADSERGNGFSFKEFSSRDMLDTLERALRLYGSSPDTWQQLVARALSQDFSWNKPGAKYLELYFKALEKKRSNNHEKEA